MSKLDIVPLEWRGDRLRILDQTQLPGQEVYLELTDYREQLTRARDSREHLVARLPAQLRSRYERIRRSKGDMAVVGLEQGACGGCGYQLPPQKIVEVQRAEHLVVCEGCGRILVSIDR